MLSLIFSLIFSAHETRMELDVGKTVARKTLNVDLTQRNECE